MSCTSVNIVSHLYSFRSRQGSLRKLVTLPYLESLRIWPPHAWPVVSSLKAVCAFCDRAGNSRTKLMTFYDPFISLCVCVYACVCACSCLFIHLICLSVLPGVRALVTTASCCPSPIGDTTSCPSIGNVALSFAFGFYKNNICWHTNI